MNFRLKIAAFTLLTIFAFACNSNKKKVETEKGIPDYSKYPRVGQVDTSAENEMIPGNITSIDDYVATIKKGIRMDLKDFKGDSKYKSIAYGGKVDVHQLTSATFVNFDITSIDIFYKENKVIFVETRHTTDKGLDLMKYYYEGDKIIATYQGGLVSNDPNSRGSFEFKSIPNIAGKEAVIKAMEQEADQKFLNSAPFKSKVYKDGAGYKAVTCFSGKELKIVDPNGFITKLFKDNPLSETSKFMLISIDGKIIEKDGKLNVAGGIFQGKDMGGTGCY